MDIKEKITVEVSEEDIKELVSRYLLENGYVAKSSSPNFDYGVFKGYTVQVERRNK